MNKPVVWVIKEQVTRNVIGANAMDYTPALAYGELKFVTRTDMPLYQNSSVRSVWDEDVCKFLAAYDASKDFIITTGQPTAIFAVGYALGKANKKPRYLVWRREDNRYRVLESQY